MLLLGWERFLRSWGVFLSLIKVAKQTNSLFLFSFFKWQKLKIGQKTRENLPLAFRIAMPPIAISISQA